MLPWTVQMGAQSWQTYSIGLPLALSRHVPSSIPSYSLLDGGLFWNESFWEDRLTWAVSLGELLQRQEAQSLAASMPGYEEAGARFTLKDPRLGWINGEPYSLFLRLVARGEALVDSIRWFNHMDQGRPQEDWPQLFEKHAIISQVAQRFTWLTAWKSGHGLRSIEAQVAGPHMHATSNLEQFVTPAWRHAELPGDHTIELVLRKDKLAVATIHFSQRSRRALILSANTELSSDTTSNAPENGHWLERAHSSFHPTKPIYLVADAQGHVEKKTIPAHFPALARVLEKWGVPERL